MPGPDAVVVLRELRGEDLPRVNQWRNDAALTASLGSNFLLIAPEVDEDWYRAYLKARDKAVRAAILVGPELEHVGNVNLTSIHSINRSAEFSILIGPPSRRGQGIGRSATTQMLAHGFRDLNLHRIYLTVLTTNVAAIAVYRSVGFADEGVRRQSVFKEGRHVDALEMSILRPDFDAKYGPLPGQARAVSSWRSRPTRTPWDCDDRKTFGTHCSACGRSPGSPKGPRACGRSKWRVEAFARG